MSAISGLPLVAEIFTNALFEDDDVLPGHVQSGSECQIHRTSDPGSMVDKNVRSGSAEQRSALHRVRDTRRLRLTGICAREVICTSCQCVAHSHACQAN
jgi:hypothetical protein